MRTTVMLSNCLSCDTVIVLIAWCQSEVIFILFSNGQSAVVEHSNFLSPMNITSLKNMAIELLVNWVSGEPQLCYSELPVSSLGKNIH
jgi:hypothetical protein